MTSSKPIGTTTTVVVIFILISLLSGGGGSSAAKQLHVRRPCKRIVVYIHEIRYDGSNSGNATSAIVGEPEWANKTSLAVPARFGDVIAFDNPLTADTNLRSPPVGRAQGFYLYAGKNSLVAWHGFSMFFNSTEHKGILNIAGMNLLVNQTRDMSVVGGTGDFFMHRGIVTLSTDAIEGEVYYRLRMEIKLYECWRLLA